MIKLSLPRYNKPFRSLWCMKPNESIQWRMMKISIVFAWLSMTFVTIFFYSNPFTPNPFFDFIDYSYMTIMWVKVFIFLTCVLLSVGYILEVKMFITTLSVTLLSYLVFSYEEANGEHNRTAIFTAVFLAQTVAYAFKKTHFKIQFSKQIVAAIYTISAISKLKASGIGWITDSKFLLLQISKESYCWYFNTGSELLLNRDKLYMHIIVNYPWILQLFMTLVLALELFAIIILINERVARIYGWLLLLMHVGIFLLMNVIVPPIVLMMVAILLNPLIIIHKMSMKPRLIK